MDEPTVADFRAKFPQFTAEIVSDAIVADLLEEAHTYTNVSATATLLCVAHLVTLEASSGSTGRTATTGGSGVVKAETLGPRKREYQTQAATAREVFFAQTSYGERMLAAEGRSPQRAFSIVTG